MDMGSIFVVTVPNRDYEKLLRKYAQNIIVGPNKTNSNGSVDRRIDIFDWEKSISDSSLLESDDVYEATVDERKARVIISSDSIKIKYFDESEESLVTQSANDSSTEFMSDVISDIISKVIKKIENTFLEKHLENCLKKLGIMAACWSPSVDGSFSQAIFTVKDDKSESIFSLMQRLGIGHKYKSSLYVSKTSLYKEADQSGPFYGDLINLENRDNRILERELRESKRREKLILERQLESKRRVKLILESLKVPIIPNAEEPLDALQTSSSQGQAG